MWKKVEDGLPEEEGRFLILVDFEFDLMSGGSIIREKVPFVSNYNFRCGWTSQLPGQSITHWMEVPKLEV